MLDTIISGYHIIYGGQLEDAAINKCRNAVSYAEKVIKEIGGDIRSAQVNGSGIMEEIKVQHTTPRDCIEQLTAVKSSRTNLVSYIREVLQEQEMKLDQVLTNFSLSFIGYEHSS